MARKEMYKMRYVTLVLCLLFSILLEEGCSQSSPQKTPSSAISIGGHTTQLGACLKIAESKGLYTKYGLQASIKLVESSKQSMAAMEAGDLDVVIGSLAAGSFNMVKKGDLVILADGSRVVPSVVIRKDLSDGGQIRALTDLKGRSIMTPREGSSSYYALSRILRGLGLRIEDVQPKYLEDSEAVASLEAKQIDAAILNEPYATLAVEKGLGIRFDMNEVAKFFPVNGQQHMVIFTTRKNLEQKADLLRNFLKAYVEAAQWYGEARSGKQPQRTEAIQIIAAYTGSDPKTVDAAVWPYVSPDGKPDVAYIKEMHDYFLQQGLADAPVDLDKAIHLELLPGN